MTTRHKIPHDLGKRPATQKNPPRPERVHVDRYADRDVMPHLLAELAEHFNGGVA